MSSTLLPQVEYDTKSQLVKYNTAGLNSEKYQRVL